MADDAYYTETLDSYLRRLDESAREAMHGPKTATSGSAYVVPEVERVKVTQGSQVRYLGTNNRWLGKVATVYWVDSESTTTPLLYLKFPHTKRRWQVTAAPREVRAIVS